MAEEIFEELEFEDALIQRSISGNPDADRGPFDIVPQSHLDHGFIDAERRRDILHSFDFSRVWKWKYQFRKDQTATEDELALAEKISRLAGALRDYDLKEDEAASKTGTGDGTKRYLEPSNNAIAIMESLLNIFAAALMNKRPAPEIKIYAKMVDDLEQDFLRRVVTKRTRTQMFRPIAWIIGAFVGFATLGLLVPSIAGIVAAFPTLKTIAAGFPGQDIIRAVCFVIAGVFLGRLIFFALTHSGSIASMDEYWKLEPQINFPELSILFDVVVGLAAFLVFQTGFLTIAIGGENGVSSSNIMDSELVAGLFGAIAGISRSAFLERVRGISNSAIKPQE